MSSFLDSLKHLFTTGDTPFTHPLKWGVFIGLLLVVLAFDLVVLGRKKAEPTFRSSAVQVVFFLSLAAAVGVCLFLFTDYGADGAQRFIAGYLVEDSMSVDNLVVLAAIMTYFGVPREHHHKVLFWGILGAIVMRAAAMFGMSLLYLVEVLPGLMGFILLYTAYSTAKSDDADEDISDSLAYKIFNRILPTTPRFYDDKFVVKINGKRFFTRLFLVVCVIETSDLLFAIDSTPPVYQTSGGDMFIAFASAIMAVLGLRSVFFFFSYLQKRLSWVNEGVALILAFVGVTMIIGNPVLMGGLHHFIPVVHEVSVPVWLDLTVIGGLLLLSVIASLIFPKKDELPITEAITSDASMVEIYVDSGWTMDGEWHTGMVRDYLNRAVRATARYDTDQIVPTYGFGDTIAPLGDFRMDETIEIERPSLGRGSDLAAVLKQAAERARTTTGQLIYVILSDFRVDDERAVREQLVVLPDNASLILVRISDEPGGAEFVDSLARDYNVVMNRVEVIHATDDTGRAQQEIADTVGYRLNDWVGTAA